MKKNLFIWAAFGLVLSVVTKSRYFITFLGYVACFSLRSRVRVTQVLGPSLSLLI